MALSQEYECRQSPQWYVEYLIKITFTSITARTRASYGSKSFLYDRRILSFLEDPISHSERERAFTFAMSGTSRDHTCIRPHLQGEDFVVQIKIQISSLLGLLQSYLKNDPKYMLIRISRLYKIFLKKKSHKIRRSKFS